MNDVKQMEQQQAAARRDIASAGLQLDDALKVVAARKSELRELVRRGVALGLTEVEIARLAGVARSSVREWLGKKT
jgi:DNA invertase Pin-like site-specific DNA recombinase